MEGVLYKTSGNIKDEAKNLSQEPEGALKSVLSSTDVSLNAKQETDQGINEQVDIDSESHENSNHVNGSESESTQQKVYSPTLIESAFNVMKNLFSPDKTKTKSANSINSVKQQQSATGSPSNSICISSKTEFTTSESGVGNSITVQSGENSNKNQLNMNQVGVLFSPLTFESHNNTDESFLTTVSIIDDSFHSAITNLDENGETIRLEINVMDNFLNNSQNLDAGSPYNDTLENSEYCLENTTLRNCSFTLEGSKVDDVSLLSKDESGEGWNSSQVNGLCNGEVLKVSGKILAPETQHKVLKEDHCGRIIQRKDDLVDAELLKKGHSKHDNAQVAESEKMSDTVNKQAGIYQELNNGVQNMNMENIFLNKSFGSLKNSSNSLEGFSRQNVCENSFDAAEGEKKTDEINFYDKQISETCSEMSNDEPDINLENSISTTTVVLNTVNSVALDYITTSLEDVSNPNTTSSQIFSADSSFPENRPEKQTSSEFDHIIYDESSPKNTSGNEIYCPAVHKPQKNKSTIGERDSSGSAPNFSKIKMHKSDELTNHRIAVEPPEVKNTLHKKKSSLDISLIKNSEASKRSTPEASPEYKLDFGTSELHVQLRESLKKKDLSEQDTEATANDTVTVSVISQQSYTVLSDDKNLIRPIIESINVDEDFSEKRTFQTDDLSTCPAKTPIPESCVTSNYCNASFGPTHSGTPTHQKQSTPLWKGNARNSPTETVQSTSLNLDSPKESIHEDKGEIIRPSSSSNSESLGQAIQMFHSNEDPSEFSPVNPINDNEVLFSNSVESEIGGNPCLAISDPNGTRILSSKDPSESNQASGKKSLGSPRRYELDHTFDKKSTSPSSSRTGHLPEGCEKLNITYDKSAGPPSAGKSNKTFTKKVDSLEIERTNQTFVVSDSPECNDMNKTFVSRGLTQNLDQKTGLRGLQMLNERFDRRSRSPLTGKTGQTVDRRLGSPVSDIRDQTFSKEKDIDGNPEKEALDTTKTFESTSGSEGAGCGKPEMQGVREEKYKPGPFVQNSDQQDSDHIDGCHRDSSGSFISGRSPNTSLVGSEVSTLLLNEGSLSRNQSLDDLAGKLGKLSLNENCGVKPIANESLATYSSGFSENDLVLDVPTEEQNAYPQSISPLDDKLRCDPYLVQLIQEQFSSNDIEKICSVVDDFSSMKLSSQIIKASEQFDKSIHENLSNAEPKLPETEPKAEKLVKPLSPKSFDFLSSIQGKPTGRDWSRESLYVKFDPLVQPNPNSLIDFTKEGEALAAEEKSPAIPHDSSVCEQLLTISPQKKPDDIVPPLTPLSHRSKACKSEDKITRINDLQNEIYFLKNLYAERERANKVRMEDYESQVAKLTAESCFLEDKLKESNEREKSLVKKMKEQTQSLGQLKIIMEEYVKVISKLTAELEALKTENKKQIEALSTEKDSYMTHLQNTEAAFTDVHAKYEKSKKTIVSLKTNEVMYRNTISEQAQKMEDFKSRAREAQEKATREFQKIQEELGETKASHNQETARLRAQLRKTELKVEALQESLEQKIKENQQLTAICDELIEGKK